MVRRRRRHRGGRGHGGRQVCRWVDRQKDGWTQNRGAAQKGPAECDDSGRCLVTARVDCAVSGTTDSSQRAVSLATALAARVTHRPRKA